MNIAGLRFILLTVSLLILGCANVNTASNTAAEISSMAGMKSAELSGGQFVLQVYYRMNRPGAPLHIYLEGDGRAWLSRTRASFNPTPKNPIGLMLAAQDPAENVMYIARPCQYVLFDKNPQCEYPYWTHQRFAPEIIESVSAVINKGMKRARADKLFITGYSGGGAVAVLVSAGRKDVQGIRTVAGNLDHKVWAEHHDIDPLRGSLNPADYAGAVVGIPQIHYLGGRDEIIGSYVAESFRAKSGPDACIKIKAIPHASHSQGWGKVWPDLITKDFPNC